MINYYNNQKKKTGKFSYFTHLQCTKISKYVVLTIQNTPLIAIIIVILL